jgi:hypothetical protein
MILQQKVETLDDSSLQKFQMNELKPKMFDFLLSLLGLRFYLEKLSIEKLFNTIQNKLVDK